LANFVANRFRRIFVPSPDGEDRQREEPMGNGTRNLLAVLAFSTLSGANGVAGDLTAIRATVPFDFMVGDTRVPAGDYVFQRNWSARAIQVNSLDSKTALTVLHNTGGVNTSGRPVALVFNKYGERHFLRELWAGGGESGVQLPRSRTEKEQLTIRVIPVRETLIASLVR
jgi:hypothetical protein